MRDLIEGIGYYLSCMILFNGIYGLKIVASEYEIVRPEFFAHIKEPALTVNVDKIGVNTACVRLMPDVEYVQILINRKEKKLLLNRSGKSTRSSDC